MTINLFCGIEIVRSSSSTHSFIQSNRSFTATTAGFIYLFYANKKRNSNKSSSCCSICVSSTVLPDKRNVWKLDFFDCLYYISFLIFTEAKAKNEEKKTHNEQRNNIRKIVVDRRVCHYTYELMFTK